MKRRACLVVALWVCLRMAAGGQTAAAAPAPPAAPVTPASMDVWSRAEAAAGAARAKQNIAGLSVAVVVGKEVRWSKGFGFADLESSVPFTATTVHRLASVSKTITAVAAMQLVEKGALDLEAPIQKYCPAFPTKQRPITARQVIGHLAGIRHYAKGENFDSTKHYDGVVDSLQAFSADPLLHDPGTEFTYSTYGYVVLGCVVEGASGMKFGDYVREKIATPAEMERTRTDDLVTIVPGRARPYQHLPNGELGNANLADTSNKVPGGGMVSTAVDLARFAIALETGKLLRPATFARMQVPMKTTEGKESPYFGWSISTLAGRTVLSHSGSQQGTATYLLMIPESGFAVAVIANTESVKVGDLAKELVEIVNPLASTHPSLQIPR